jgi:aspartyl-tRNA synthetase
MYPHYCGQVNEKVIGTEVTGWLVPSRAHAVKFFTLPRSPQIHNQLLIEAGFDLPHPLPRMTYEMVLNGSEIGGSSARIHRQEMQSTVFDLLGIAPEEAQLRELHFRVRVPQAI